MDQSRVTEIKKFGLKARGRSELLKHLNGESLQSGQTIIAKCYECMGYYADGRCSCQIKDCPLWSWMPYRDVETE